MSEQQQQEQKQVKPVTVGVDETAIAFRPKNFEELWGFAKIICETDFVPNAFKNKPGACLAAVQYGHEVGLKPMQALRWIAVINGNPTVWGDGYWAIIRNHPLCEWTKELGPDEALEKGYGECTIKRKNDPEPVTRRFTLQMANDAGLIERSTAQGPWTKYRGRMLQQRARHLCGSDAIPEATGGLMPAEIAKDYDHEITGTQIDEPLKVPQATKEETHATNADRTDGNQPIDTESQKASEKSGNGKPDGRADHQDGSGPHVADRKKQALEFIQNSTDEEFTRAGKKWLNEQIKGMAQADQMAVVKAYNERHLNPKEATRA